ncbi:MAG: diguanylate cyclase [Gammaproteobacteria bacterium]|nr:diguanylate cyclase [Gammaproteobacteria bacterium]
MPEARQASHRWLALLLFSLCSSALAAGADDWPLTGAWRPGQPGDTPAQVLAEAAHGQLQPFDPAQLHQFVRNPYGAWLVLWPQAPGLSGARVLSIPSPPLGRVVLYGADGPVASADITDAQSASVGFGCLALEIPAHWSAAAPLLVRFEPATTINVPVAFRLQSLQVFKRMDLLWTLTASAGFGVMLAMALMALCFGLMLRDVTFGWYAGYVTTYALIQAIQTGFLFHPLQWGMTPETALRIGVMATAISVACAVMFMLRFCALERHAPRMRILLLALTVTLLALTALRFSDQPELRQVAQNTLNPLIAVGAGMALLGAFIALLHGSRSAVFFLLGWFPLLTLTALSSAQVSGVLPGLIWLNAAMLPAGALEAIVLSLGLADRALTIRREHAVARALADRDPLTGILNRRAWIEMAQARIDRTGSRPQTLLFIDLDRFKTLNDVMGHAAGDRALNAIAEAISTELRPDDLVARLGGDEFAALLNNTDGEKALRVAERLRNRVDRLEIPVDPSGQRLSLSVGLAQLHAGESLGVLIERADAAMYAAKARGGNRCMDRPDALSGRILLRQRKPAGALTAATEPPAGDRLR